MKRIFIFLLLTLFSISFVSALSDSDAISYYTFDSDVNDYYGLYNGTNSGTTSVAGKISNARDVDSTDYINIGDVSELEGASEFTICGWYDFDTSSTAKGFFSYGTSTNDMITAWTSGGNIFYLQVNNGGNTYGSINNIHSSIMPINQYLFICIVYDGSGATNADKLKLYVDNTEETLTYTGTIPATTSSTMNSFYIGRNQQQTISNDGQMDEFSIFNRALNTSDLTSLYNSGTGLQPPFSAAPPAASITIDDISLVNNSYHNSNIDIQLNLSVSSTNANVNSSYILYETFNSPLYNGSIISQSSINPLYTDTGTTRNQFCIDNNYDSASGYTTSSYSNPAYYYTGTIWTLTTINSNKYDSITCQKNTQYGTNTLQPNVTIDISSLEDSSYNIKFVTENNETQTNSSLYTFTIDTTNPSTQVITNQTEFNSFSVNMSNIFNYSDTNIDTCEIYLTELSNVSINDTATLACDTLYNFSTAGLHNLRINVTDLAGNYNDTTQLNITINPFVYVDFYDPSLLAAVADFNATVLHPDGRLENAIIINDSVRLSPVNNGDLDLGNHTITFIKDGYNQDEFIVLINDTNANTNYTFNVTRVTLSIKMYDFSSPTTQLTFNLTIMNSTNTLNYTNQVNFSQYYNNTVNGDIIMIVSSDGYTNTEYINTLDPFTSIEVIGYLVPENDSEVVQFSVTSGTGFDALANVLVEVQLLVGAEYVTIAQKYTADNGKAYFFLDILEEYKVIFTKDGYVTATAFSIPTVTEYNVRLSEVADAYEYVDDISYAINPSNILLDTNTTYNFNSFISSTSLSIIFFNLKYGNGTSIYSSSSTNPTGTTFDYSHYIPSNVNSSTIIANLTYVKSGIRQEILKTYTIFTIDNTSTLQVLKNYGNQTDEDTQIVKWLIVMFITTITIITGTIMGIRGVNLMLIPILAFFAWISWIDWVISAVISVVMLILFVGGGNR